VRHDCRTKGQNEILITHVLEELAKGNYLKLIAAKYNIRFGTLTNLLTRYRKRHGFKNMYHMLAIYIVVRERKGAKKLAPLKASTKAFSSTPEVLPEPEFRPAYSPLQQPQER
jgi:hypothetical protein